MTLKKDKKKVLGEVFDDERIKSFLEFQAPEGVDPDFHLLEKAYRGMKVENFATFLDYFVEQNRNINATNSEGKTFLQIVSQHEQGGEYAQALKDAGAV